MSGFELRISGVGSNATGLNALANFGKTLLRIWVVTNWIYNLAYWSRLISTYTSSSIVLVGSKALSPLKVHSLTRSPRKVEVKETTDIGTLIPDCSPIHLRLLGNEPRSRCNKQILSCVSVLKWRCQNGLFHHSIVMPRWNMFMILALPRF